jgi:hypothetical protein
MAGVQLSQTLEIIPVFYTERIHEQMKYTTRTPELTESTLIAKAMIHTETGQSSMARSKATTDW